MNFLFNVGIFLLGFSLGMFLVLFYFTKRNK